MTRHELAKMPAEDLKAALAIQQKQALKELEAARQKVRKSALTKAGRPPSPRCKCGKYTVGQAKKKEHDCK